MTEGLLSTGRSSFFDNYHSDIETNSDTINDFSQYSDNGILKVNSVERLELTPEPMKKTTVPIVVENISPNVKNGFDASDNDSTDIDDYEDDNSLFEITKKKTIRKIISRTTMINGVEKENEVKEFLIKDSQVNDSLLNSKKSDGTFMSSRRGSHASVRRNSLVDKKNKEKHRHEKSRKDIELGDNFKSDLEKIDDELEYKDNGTQTKKGKDFESPHEVVNSKESCGFRFRFGQEGTNGVSVPNSNDIEEIHSSSRMEHLIEDKNSNGSIKINFTDRQSRAKVFEEQFPGADEIGQIKRYVEPINVEHRRPIKNEGQSTNERLANGYSDYESDIVEILARDYGHGNNTSVLIPNRNFTEDVNNNNEMFDSKISRDSNEDVRQNKVDIDGDIDEKFDCKITYGSNQQKSRDTGYSSPGKEGGDRFDFDEESPVQYGGDQRLSNNMHKSVPREFPKYDQNTTDFRWIDPMKSYHLKYDSKNDNNNPKKSIEGRRRSSVNPPVIENSQSSKICDYKKMNGNLKSKPVLINEIRDYIIRGNIKENLFHIRHQNTVRLESPTNRRVSHKRSDSNSKTLSSPSKLEKFKSPSYTSSNQIKELPRTASWDKMEFHRSSRTSTRFVDQNSALKRYDSLDSSLSRPDSINSQVSVILNKVDDLEKHLTENSQSMGHICPSYVHNVCGHCWHGRCCYDSICVERVVRLNTVARLNLANSTRNLDISMETFSNKNGQGLKNANKPEKSTITLQDKRIHILEKRLHTLQKHVQEFKTSEERFRTQPEMSVKSQCQNIERQLQLLYDSIHNGRGLS